MADKKVYLPRQKVRPGFRHSYQGDHVVIVDADARQVPATIDNAPKKPAAKPAKSK